MVEEHIKEYLNKWVDRYKHILERYYPSHGKTGFTERNLTVNFASAIEGISMEAFTWYEAPIENKFGQHDNHLDAVMFEPIRKEIFLVEAKRIKEPKEIESIGKDIQRICSERNIDTIKNGLKGKKFETHFEDANIYGLIIADVWTKKKNHNELPKSWENCKIKKEILEAFVNKKFIDEYSGELGIETNFVKEYNAKCFAQEISIDEKTPSSVENYNLLALVFKIK